MYLNLKLNLQSVGSRMFGEMKKGETLLSVAYDISINEYYAVETFSFVLWVYFCSYYPKSLLEKECRISININIHFEEYVRKYISFF